MRSSQAGGFIPATALWIWFILIGSVSAAQDRPGEAEAKSLVAMVRGSFVDTTAGPIQPTLGAAVVLGFSNGRLYLITANHVVRREGQVASELSVELRALPAEKLPAEVLPHKDADLDLAILIVRDAGHRGVSEEFFAFDRLGDPTALDRGASVYSIGQARAQPWWSNVDPDLLAARSALYLDFESKLISGGQSGGGLFDAEWRLIGLIIQDRPPNTRALTIDLVLDFARSHGYPVALSPHTTPGANCVTEKDNFDSQQPHIWDVSPGGNFGFERSMFRISVFSPGFNHKRCIHCREKALVYKISATLEGITPAASAGLYVLDASEVRGEWFTFEIETGGKAYLRHIRDGREPVTLWAGTYPPKPRSRLSLEASRGMLTVYVDDRRLGRAEFDPMLFKDLALGSGFVVSAGSQTPATAFFDDYEFTVCYPPAR